MQELTDAIRLLANGKSVGPDGVSVELFKITRALHGSALETRRKWYGWEFHGFSNGTVYGI